jgi:acetyl-CoA acyltransferase
VADVLYGCANQAGEDNRNVARMSALLAGLPIEVPGATINRLCGSGLDTVGSAARAIRCDEAELMIAGGVEETAGAYLAPDSLSRAWARINPSASLDKNEGYGYFQALGDPVITGPTLTTLP